MLTVETIGRIPREHFIKGKTIREIAPYCSLMDKCPHSAEGDMRALTAK